MRSLAAFLLLLLLLLSSPPIITSTLEFNRCKQSPCTQTLIPDQLSLTWQYNTTTNFVHFTLTYTTSNPSNQWIALGVQSPDNTNNRMIGPPASQAAFADGTSIKMYALQQMAFPMGSSTSIKDSALTLQANNMVMDFTVDRFGPHALNIYPPGAPVPFLFAIGRTIDGVPQRHTRKEGIAIVLHKTNATIDDPKIGFVLDAHTLRLYHGVALTIIWGFCTIVGAGFARYCRHKWYWYTAHRGCQSLGGLLTLPLTFLAYFSKTDKHYSWMHGTFGLFLGIASTVQGLLGTFAARSHRHWFGLHNPPWVDHALRTVHRMLGKTLLLLAFVQIMLGIEEFAPSSLQTTIVGPLFLGYSSVLWATVIALELSPFGPFDYCRCKSKTGTAGFQAYDIQTGTGFLTKDDITRDHNTFLALKKLAVKVLQLFGRDVRQRMGGDPCCAVCGQPQCHRSMETCLVKQWWDQSRKCNRCCCASSWKFMRGHRSLSTKLLFRFVEWVLDHPKMAARTNKTEQESMVGFRNHLAGKEVVVVFGGVWWCLVGVCIFNTDSSFFVVAFFKLLELKSIHFTKTKFPTIAKNKIEPSLFTTSIDRSNSDVPPPPDQEHDDDEGDPWGADGEFDAWGGGGGFDGADSQFAIRYRS